MIGHPIHIGRAVRTKVVADCDARWPEEACGVLLANRAGRIVDAVVLDNVWPEPAERVRRFSIEPLAQLRVERDAEAAGLSVTGFYHSHPSGPAVPSSFDLGRAWPTYCYLIVGYSDGVCVEFRVWRLDDGVGFVEHAVSLED